MTLFILGINHASAPLELREQVVFASGTMTRALQQFMSSVDVAEAAILSTCNRTEVYLSASCPTIGDQTLQWIADYHQMDASKLIDCHYSYHDDMALEHMMKVACGLDSMILGEPQILGQMKSCYAMAQASGSLGSELHGIFQRVFSTAKQVRSQTSIGENPVSVAYAAVTLSQQIFSDLSQRKTLLIGAGETIELVGRHLQDKGVEMIVFANRTLQRAQTLASKFGGQAIVFGDIPRNERRCPDHHHGCGGNL